MLKTTSFLNAIKTLGVTTVLKKAVDAYKNRKEEIISSDNDVEAQEIVNHTLSQAFEKLNIKNEGDFFYENTAN